MRRAISKSGRKEFLVVATGCCDCCTGCKQANEPKLIYRVKTIFRKGVYLRLKSLKIDFLVKMKCKQGEVVSCGT